MQRIISGVTVDSLVETDVTRRLVKIAREIVESTDKRLRLVTGDRSFEVCPADSLRILASSVPEDGSVRAIHSLLSRTCYDAERSAPFGAYLTLSLLSGLVEECVVRRLRSDDLERLAGQCEIDEWLAYPVIESMKNAGGTATVVVERSQGDSKINITTGVSCSIELYEQFGDSVSMRDAAIFVYDGVIERVSVISRLLDRFFESKQNCLILARGYGAEVVSTLLHNWRYRNTRIVPLSAGTSDSPWELLDIARVLGSVPNDLVNGRSVAAVKADHRRLVISDNNVETAAASLSREVLNESKDLSEGVKVLAQRRSSNLTGRKVVISVGNEYGTSGGIIFDRMTSFVRTAIDSRQNGVVVVNDKMFPVAGLLAAKQAKKTLDECGRCVIIA